MTSSRWLAVYWWVSWNSTTPPSKAAAWSRMNPRMSDSNPDGMRQYSDRVQVPPEA